jgi:hypothetical protein
MKNPKFGKNKIRSFIEFDTEVGRLRIHISYRIHTTNL